MDFSQISTAIIKGELDNRLDDIIAVIKGRRDIKGREKFFELQVGDRVRFVASVRPSSLAGRVGRLIEHKNKKVVVDLDMPIGKWWKGIRTPVNLIERVDEKDFPVTKPSFVKITGPIPASTMDEYIEKREEMIITPEDVGEISIDPNTRKFSFGEK
jgi:hypothetical protein